MQIAKWNEQTQTPYDIRDRYSVKAGNGVPYSEMASLNRIGYYEYQPVILADGEGLDNPTYALDGGVISQGGTVVSAAEMQARAQQARHDEVLAMAAEYGSDVAILGRLLDAFGVTLPCDPTVAIQTIKGGLASGEINFALAPQADAAEGRYRALREHMTDEDIAAVAVLVGAE